MIALMKEKANEKDVVFIHYDEGSCKLIAEKGLTGKNFVRSGNSIYLWAFAENDKNMLG